MEKFRVTFEMINDEKHFYEIESKSKDDLYNLINTCPDGWIELVVDGESHFVKADKLTRVIIISENDFIKRQKESEQQIAQAFESWNSF